MGEKKQFSIFVNKKKHRMYVGNEYILTLFSFAESTSFRSPSSGSGSSGIGSSNSSTSGGPNIGSSTSAGSGTVPGGTTRGKTPRTHQDDSEESGVGHEEDEEMQQLLVELLSLIRTPKVYKMLF